MAERIRFRKWLLTLFCTDTTGFTEDTGKNILIKSFNNYDILIISPYHNKDLDTEPHYHVILQDSRQIDFTKIKNLISCIHCEPQRSNNITAYNYLYHNTKDSKDKYQYDKSEIYCNMDSDMLLLWLGNNDKVNNSREVGLDIISTIENSNSLWSVIKSYPEYWRDVSKIKDLWYLYELHKFQEMGNYVVTETELRNKDKNIVDENQHYKYSIDEKDLL